MDGAASPTWTTPFCASQVAAGSGCLGRFPGLFRAEFMAAASRVSWPLFFMRGPSDTIQSWVCHNAACRVRLGAPRQEDALVLVLRPGCRPGQRNRAGLRSRRRRGVARRRGGEGAQACRGEDQQHGAGLGPRDKRAGVSTKERTKKASVKVYTESRNYRFDRGGVISGGGTGSSGSPFPALVAVPICLRITVDRRQVKPWTESRGQVPLAGVQVQRRARGHRRGQADSSSIEGQTPINLCLCSEGFALSL